MAVGYGSSALAAVIGLLLAATSAQAQRRGMPLSGPLGADTGSLGGSSSYDVGRAGRDLPPGESGAARARLEERGRDVDRAERQRRAGAPGEGSLRAPLELGIGKAAIRIGGLLSRAEEGMGRGDLAGARADTLEARGLLDGIRGGPQGPIRASDPNLRVLESWLGEIETRAGR